MGGGNLKNKPTKKGFTLIELLAVIVILAIIALIAIPQVIKILNKSRISSAEDSVYGIVSSAENYITEFMLKNNGELPNEEIVFNCTKTGCILDKTNLTNYKLDGLEELDFKGTKPTSGKVGITKEGKITATNIVINGFFCNYPNEDGKVSCEEGNEIDNNKERLEKRTYVSGEAITNFAGYNWHIISDDGSNVTLLMDANQLGNNSDMKHCTNDTDASTDCGVDSTGTYYVYSWDKSLIRSYLNNELKNTLEEKISNEIVPVSICIDQSRGDGIATYGGYLKEEIENINEASCNNGYETDYVRLITYSEYWNLSPSYSGTSARYPNVSGITRLSSNSDYANWLYCSSGKCGASNIYSGAWWTMTSLYHNTYFHVMSLYYINYSGGLSYEYGERVYGVRPVITIRK